MHRSEEFLMSDDSDVPELDLPAPGRQKKLRLFRPRTLNQDSVAKARSCCSPTCGLVVLLTSLVVAVVFLGASYMRLLNHLEGVIVLPERLKIVEHDLHRINQQLKEIKPDAVQTVKSSSDLTKSDFDQLTEQIKNISDALQKLNVGSSLKSLQEEIDKLNEHCAVCKIPGELGKGSDDKKAKTQKEGQANDKEAPKKKRSKSSYEDKPVVFVRKDT